MSDGINTDRTFVEYIPTSYDKDTPMPVMIYFHGQGGNAMSDAESCKYTSVGEENGFVSLYPQGLGKAKGEEVNATSANCGTGWNVGEFRVSAPTSPPHHPTVFNEHSTAQPPHG